MNRNIHVARASSFTIALLAISLPAFSHAATYAYVNQSGQLSTVVANTPTDAIRMAPNIAVHSGVMLTEGSSVGSLPNPILNPVVVVPPNSSSAGTYAYVNTAGVVVTINADSSAMALANAVNKDAHSGVVLLSNTSTDIALVGDQVSGV